MSANSLSHAGFQDGKENNHNHNHNAGITIVTAQNECDLRKKSS